MARRIVAFIDVLGFKALVENVPQGELVEIYRELQLAARLQTTRAVFPEDARRFDQDAHYEDHEIGRGRVVNVMASDSIVVYSASDEYTDALAVGAAVRGLLVAGFRNGIALRGALAIGEPDELDLKDDASNAQNWTARFAGLVGRGLVHAYELEERCAWSGAILHPDLVAHLDDAVLHQAEDGPLTALDFFCSIQLLLETEAPLKGRGPDGKPRVVHERCWAIHWPFVTDSLDWAITEEKVAGSFTSFGRTAASPDVEAKRDETVAFMRRAKDDSAATLNALKERRRICNAGGRGLRARGRIGRPVAIVLLERPEARTRSIFSTKGWNVEPAVQDLAYRGVRQILHRHLPRLAKLPRMGLLGHGAVGVLVSRRREDDVEISVAPFHRGEHDRRTHDPSVLRWRDRGASRCQGDGCTEHRCAVLHRGTDVADDHGPGSNSDVGVEGMRVVIAHGSSRLQSVDQWVLRAELA